MIKSKVGIEAEFFLLNSDGNVIIPPRNWDRDGFPLLGEIRGKEGGSIAETLANFDRAKYNVFERLSDGQAIAFVDLLKIPLKTYQEVNAEIKYIGKGKDSGEVRNIYDTDIEKFSDQIVSKGKIQGINASCGLHVHFSCEEVDEKTLEVGEYEAIRLPITVPLDIVGDKKEVLSTLLRSDILLHRCTGFKKESRCTARASKLNLPTIRWIVSEMDKDFFQVYAPELKQRTKYRQPGFYEMKPYGFEYRSLPANTDTMKALPEIIKKAFALLEVAAT